MKVSINGNDVELPDPEEGSIVTDVVILRRAVVHRDGGQLADSIFIDNSLHTTSIVQIGMLEAARKITNSFAAVYE